MTPADFPQSSPLSAWIDSFRLCYLLVGLGCLALMWRRPRPGAVMVLLVAANLAAWAAYVAPLGRLYALDERNDRAFNVALAATVAAGNSPWEHTQVGVASLEPFWDVIVASMALFRPEAVITGYQGLAPLSIIVVALGLFYGMRLSAGGSADEWERTMVVLAVFGLASVSMTGESPIPPFWSGHFLYKPNHACALGVLGVVAGMYARRATAWWLGLALGLLAWSFIVTWGFAVLGLVAATALRPAGERDWRHLAFSVAVSVAIVSPDLVNLARDYSPLASGGGAHEVWRATVPIARVLALPRWVVGDLGILLVLGAVGALVLRSRRSRRDSMLLGLLAAAWGLWAASAGGALLGYAFESDEMHYYVRLTLALCAGSALAAVARHAASWWSLGAGRAHVLVVAAFWPMTFPAYFDPLRMDRFYPPSVSPIGDAERELGLWVAHNTPGDAVFIAGPSAANWIGVLAGRRALLSGNPPRDYSRRKEAEAVVLLSQDPEVVRHVAKGMGVSYLAIDRELAAEYGATEPRLADTEVFEHVFSNARVKIWRIVRPD